MVVVSEDTAEAEDKQAGAGSHAGDGCRDLLMTNSLSSLPFIAACIRELHAKCTFIAQIAS